MNLSEHISPEIWNYLVIPLLIVIARIFDVTIGTLRIIFVSKGLKLLAPVLGFFEVLIWLLAIGQIMKNLTNPMNYFAYATGFALGTFFGIQVEHMLAMGISMIRVITNKDASKLVQHLRNNGQIVTSLDAEGNHGPVKVFFTIVKRKQQKAIVGEIKKFNPNAFYTIEDISYIHLGVIPSARHKRNLFKLLDLKRK